MNCVKCGNVLEPNAKFCSYCGAKVDEEQTALLVDDEQTGLLVDDEQTGLLVDQDSTTLLSENGTSVHPTNAQQIDHEDLTRKDFYERYASKKTKSWVTAMVVVCFLSAGVSLIPLFFGSFLSIVDIAFYAAMAGLLLYTKNWTYALIPTIYSGFFSVVNLASGGSMSGVFALIAGIMSTISLNKVNKAYQTYKNHTVLPDSEI